VNYLGNVLICVGIPAPRAIRYTPRDVSTGR
jgi:hypothetical protein